MASHTTDDGFHEIQLNGKQLVFLFMAATVVSVVIFLCGVLVGRGVRAERTVAQSLRSTTRRLRTFCHPRRRRRRRHTGGRRSSRCRAARARRREVRCGDRRHPAGLCESREGAARAGRETRAGADRRRAAREIREARKIRKGSSGLRRLREAGTGPQADCRNRSPPHPPPRNPRRQRRPFRPRPRRATATRCRSRRSTGDRRRRDRQALQLEGLRRLRRTAAQRDRHGVPRAHRHVQDEARSGDHGGEAAEGRADQALGYSLNRSRAFILAAAFGRPARPQFSEVRSSRIRLDCARAAARRRRRPARSARLRARLRRRRRLLHRHALLDHARDGRSTAACRGSARC